MNEKIESEMHALLNNFWILKEENQDLYYSIKRHQEELKNFITKNLGSRLIIHERFIKLEKIPSASAANLGISTFKEPTDYSYLCLILLFLEDKTRDTYFTLTSLIDYVKNTSVTLELNNVPDWTLSKHRKSLARAIDFLLEIKAIKLNDENGVSFKDDANAEALYTSTGLSNYVMRIFNNDIFTYTEESDFIKDEWTYQNDDKGDVRKYKVYRNLIYTPVVFSKFLSESELDYIKKLRGHMSEELMNNLGYELEVTKNMALVYEYESSIKKDSFPNSKKITDVVLMVNSSLLSKIENNEIVLDEYEIGHIPANLLFDILMDIKKNKKIYLSKMLYDLSDENFFTLVVDYMEDYSFLRKINDEYEIYPSIRIFTSKLIIDRNSQLELWSDENV